MLSCPLSLRLLYLPTQTLVCSLVLSHLDSCTSLLSGCPQYLLDKLQKVQNDHIHPILETLHWLPVTHHIKYKISTICFNSISGTAPQDLSSLLQPCTLARQLRKAKTFGERSFSMLAHLSGTVCFKTLHHSDSASLFKAALKTHLFNNYF